MYEAHFGISGPPFQLSPDPAFYFDSKGHHDALALLKRGLAQTRGIILVSGEIGAGKTTLVRTLLSSIDPATLAVGQVLSTQLDDLELLRAILLAFGAPAEENDEQVLRRALQTHLLALAREGRRGVVVIDEAQNLHRTAFEMLVEIEAGAIAGGLPVKLCLVGQPELRDMIGSDDLASLRARIEASWHLAPLTGDETGAYVMHRLRKVGWAGKPSFTAPALTEIHRWTAGVPRRINLLCNRLMLGCFLESRSTVDAADVERAAIDLRAEIGDTSPMPAKAGPSGSPPGRGATPPPSSREGEDGSEASTPPILTDIVVPQGNRPIVLVAASAADHVQAAALLRAFAARDDLPVCLLVRPYANNAFDRNKEMFAGLDIEGRIVPLGIAGGTHAGRAAALMQRFEFVAERCQPAAAVVFGGSDAALSCGLVASRRAIPVAHVGAGLRARGHPGATDITRKLTDQLADVLYTSEAEASERLLQEGLARDRIALVGNLQVDALQTALRSALAGGPRERPGLPVQYLSDRNGYGVVVLDATSNVNDRQTLSELVAMLREVSRDVPLVWPMPTRTREQLVKFKLDATLRDERIACLTEQPYVSFVQLLTNATCVLTDSWHVQEEATALGIPCLAIGVEAERPVVSAVGSTVAVGLSKALATRTIWDCIFNGGKRGSVPEWWDGQTGMRIAEHLALWLHARAARTPAAAAVTPGV